MRRDIGTVVFPFPGIASDIPGSLASRALVYIVFKRLSCLRQMENISRMSSSASLPIAISVWYVTRNAAKTASIHRKRGHAHL